MTEELWQLYDEQGRPIPGKGVRKPDIKDGLLHAAVHVWVWRRAGGAIELLLQKRAAGKRTWPDRWDTSAAGHIDLGEDPVVSALRETEEELGLNFAAQDLWLIGVTRCKVIEENTGVIENEFHWTYLAELKTTELKLERDEVDTVAWKKPDDIRADVANPDTREKYVPHVQAYFTALFEAVEQL